MEIAFGIAILLAPFVLFLVVLWRSKVHRDQKPPTVTGIW